MQVRTTRKETLLAAHPTIATARVSTTALRSVSPGVALAGC